MSISVSNIVEVNINRQSTALKEQNFNVPLILGFNTLPAFKDNIAIEFYNPSELLSPEIGFTSTSTEYLIAQQIYAQQPSISKFIVARRKVSTNSDVSKQVYKINDDLDEVIKVNNDWYCLFLADFFEKEDLLSACRWIESSKCKIASFRTSDKSVFDTSKKNISSELSAVGFNRCMLTYHANKNEFPDAAILGKYLSKEAGTYCLAHKQLLSLTSQNISDREFNILQNSNCNIYTDILGVPTFQDGRVLNTVINYLDNTITEDALKSKIQSKIFGAFAAVDKIPFEESGLQIIETQVKSVLDEFDKKKAILKDWEIKIPTVEEINNKYKNCRQKRELKNIWFKATINGAIQKVQINGDISY
ncbi:MAG: DUF3383 family protein [Spirobacillus cienkowskii]|jgi:hypothetical protein|uniref:DUF3383 family protein n=1 Tax=Spirobacillus cienkowskii TaxID=495820 RepID=A0A369KX60_9BACT|nr:MAG: DUF3383 family protein [Spirobacillus cienkowskii]